VCSDYYRSQDIDQTQLEVRHAIPESETDRNGRREIISSQKLTRKTCGRIDCST
jgi:hypothetical protein